jgi:hypothetical protein
MEQTEWFDKMRQLTNELHNLSHKAPHPESQSYDDIARVRLTEVAGAACDVLSYITGTSSWDTKQLQVYDKFCIREEIKRVLMWHLR